MWHQPPLSLLIVYHDDTLCCFYIKNISLFTLFLVFQFNPFACFFFHDKMVYSFVVTSVTVKIYIKKPCITFNERYQFKVLFKILFQNISTSLLHISYISIMQKHTFRNGLSFSKRTHLWRKVWNSQKIKSAKNFIIKKAATKVFQVCVSTVYDSFILKFSISISTSTAMILSIKILVSKKTAIGRWKKSHGNDKLLEKITSSSYHMEQKAFIEASCIYNIHTLEKHFLQLLLLKVCELFGFRLENLKFILVCKNLLLLL